MQSCSSSVVAVHVVKENNDHKGKKSIILKAYHIIMISITKKVSLVLLFSLSLSTVLILPFTKMNRQTDRKWYAKILKHVNENMNCKMHFSIIPFKFILLSIISDHDPHDFYFWSSHLLSSSPSSISTQIKHLQSVFFISGKQPFYLMNCMRVENCIVSNKSTLSINKEKTPMYYTNYVVDWLKNATHCIF